jgi:hypothetical protein
LKSIIGFHHRDQKQIGGSERRNGEQLGEDGMHVSDHSIYQHGE